MPLWIGSYLKATRRLSTLQHGVYLLLIMEYWCNSGLPNDDNQLAQIAGLTSQEWKKHKPVIQSFFHDGWRHDRIDKELADSAVKSTQAKRAAEKRWGRLNGHAIGDADA